MPPGHPWLDVECLHGTSGLDGSMKDLLTISVSNVLPSTSSEHWHSSAMSTDSMPTEPSTAGAQVFHVAELRIAILCNLQVRDLLRCRRVSRSFNDTLCSALQRELFLRTGRSATPSVALSPSAADRPQKLVSGIRNFPHVGLRIDAKPDDTVETLYSPWRTCTANDALFGDLRMSCGQETSSTAFGATLPFQHFRSIKEMHAPEACNMLLTQPPVHCVQVHWQFRDGISISAMTRTIRGEEGLRWRDVLKTLPAQLLAIGESEVPRLEHCFVRLRNGWVAVRNSGAMNRT